MRNRRKNVWTRVAHLMAWLVVSGVLLAIATDAFARAGGGGGYRGGGGGGGGGGGFHVGGGGGGGGNDGGLFNLIFYLIFQVPAIGVPALIVIVVLFFYLNNQTNGTAQSNTIRRGQQAMREEDKSTAIERVQSHDPQFEEVAFCRRVHLAFDKIQSAWCMQNVAVVRPFISDGVHERFLLQFEEQKLQGYRDHMENIRVDWIDIARVSSEGLFDEVTVRIRAAASDWRESLVDGKRLSGSTQVEPFVEYWTFLRHRTANTTVGRAGLIEGNCPNCGGPIELNQAAQCTHCKALLRSGEYDWVLSEITQESEWAIDDRAALPGVVELRQRDPDFDTVAIEDRASVMFWRKAKSDWSGKIDPLKKIALPEFAESYAAQLKSDSGSRRTFAGDCAVGAVNTLGIITGEKRDQALVTVRWSGKEFITDAAGRARNTGEDLWASSLFVLARNSTVKTNLDNSISSAHCPNCGAPEAGGTSNACEFCGTVLNDGSHDWVLETVMNQNDPQARLLQAQLESHGGPPSNLPDSRTILAWMVRMAAVDGQVDPRERESLTRFAARWAIAPDQVEAMIAAALRGNLSVPEPRGISESHAWLDAMATLAWADGKIMREEMELLQSVGLRAGLSEYDITQLVRSARSRVLGESRAATRRG